MKAKDRLIVALDVSRRAEAQDMIARLGDRIAWIKIGSRLFTAEGPSLVEEMAAAGLKVFLDLKYHDIPSVVAEAAAAAAGLGVSMVTLHTLGGAEMMAAAARRIREWRRSPGAGEPWLIGVTILTSLEAASLPPLGIDRRLDEMVVLLAHLAQANGLDGVVCSPQELVLLRAQGPSSLKIITPGIRPVWSDAGDQQRTLTPVEAIRRGADYLVIGRPITRAADPVQAADRILEEMEQALP